MNNPHAPTLGATSSCPCNLSSIKPSLQALASKAKASGGQLTPTQAQLFEQLCEAWQYTAPLSRPALGVRLMG